MFDQRNRLGYTGAPPRLTPEDVNEQPKKLKVEAEKAGLSSDEFTVIGIGITQSI